MSAKESAAVATAGCPTTITRTAAAIIAITIELSVIIRN